jgi:hypothetical protein
MRLEQLLVGLRWGRGDGMRSRTRNPGLETVEVEINHRRSE